MTDDSENFNGPSRELPAEADHLEESVYCVQCGTIFVGAGTARDCPNCTNAERIAELEAQLEAIEDVVDGKLDEISSQLDQIKATTSVLADVADEPAWGDAE